MIVFSEIVAVPRPTQPRMMALRDSRPRDERVAAEARQSRDGRAVQHEEFDQRRRDHYAAEEHRGSAREPRDDEQVPRP